ncbi:MAG: UDP-N-acetylmuramoyl-L-alanine--D-glutamate ligase [Pseudomonadota bacterium]
MIPVTEYAGRDVAVFGLGRTGLSAAKALAVGGARVHAWDDDEATRNRAVEAGVTLSDINKRDWQGFAALVLSPGVPYRYPQPHRLVRMAESVGVPIVGDMELFARAVQALPERGWPKVVGITGTNGKSTTTALIGHILRHAGMDARVGGNIGQGVLDMAALHANAVYVLELSSYQLDLVKSLHCNVAVFLNLSADHLDRHGSMENYLAAKKRIFAGQQANDTAVIGVDDLYSQSLSLELKRSPARVWPISSDFALGKGVSAVGGHLFDSLSGKSVCVGDLGGAPALRGSHNHQNVAAAFAACRALGVDAKTILAGIENFPGLPHRLEIVAEKAGVTFINDSKATNAQAASQALKAFDRVYWIAGGKSKAEGIAPLEAYFPKVAKAYLIGEAEEAFAKTLKGKALVRKSGTLEAAVADAFADARASGEENPVVLLSPACSSFDQFSDFEARGEAFRMAVETLREEAAEVETA